MALKIIDKESSLWGWGRITATLTALVSFGAIVLGQPDIAALDFTDLASTGTEVINASYLLIAKLGLLISAALTLWSKIRPFMPWINK